MILTIKKISGTGIIRSSWAMASVKPTVPAGAKTTTVLSSTVYSAIKPPNTGYILFT
jgi:hypothetical protein